MPLDEEAATLKKNYAMDTRQVAGNNFKCWLKFENRCKNNYGTIIIAMIVMGIFYIGAIKCNFFCKGCNWTELCCMLLPDLTLSPPFKVNTHNTHFNSHLNQ